MRLTGFIASIVIAIPVTAFAQASDAPESQPMPLADVRSIISEQQKDRAADAITALEQYADRHNAEALMLLGDIYATGSLTQIDGAKAADFYQRSIDAGAKFAKYKLAELYRLGDVIPEDKGKAAELYEASAADGLAPAKVRLGLAYVDGQGVEADIDRGLGLLREAAATGDQMALNALGNIFSTPGNAVPPDAEEALKHFKRSAAAGNAFAMIRLGNIYLSGTLVDADVKEAMRYLRQASDAGVQQADVIIANAHLNGQLGGASKPSEGMIMLEKLAEAGSSEARASLADAYYFGKNTKRDTAKAVSILQLAAGQGDVLAAQRLIYFYRDAPAKGIAKDVDRAQKIFESVSSQMSPTVAARERVLLAAASAQGTGSLAEMAELLNEVPTNDQQTTISALRFTNPNAFVYIAQKRLREKGVYSGPLNGLLTSSTIRAMNTLCSTNCRMGPLNPESVKSLSVALAKTQ